MRRLTALATLVGCAPALLSCVACVGQELHAEDPDATLELARKFVDDRAFRRDTLEDSLVVRDNGYARLRLDAYALEDGWDALPVFEPVVRSVGDDSAEFAPVASMDDRRPGTRGALLALGATVFERWPAQRVSGIDTVLRNPAWAERTGLVRSADGRVGALVRVRYQDGSEHYALTCASFYARLQPDGTRLDGAAAALDLASLLAAGSGEGPVTAERFDGLPKGGAGSTGDPTEVDGSRERGLPRQSGPALSGLTWSPNSGREARASWSRHRHVADRSRLAAPA